MSRRLRPARAGEYLAFLVAPPCGDLLTPYLVVTSRPYTSASWAPRDARRPVVVAVRLRRCAGDRARRAQRPARISRGRGASARRPRLVVSSTSSDGGRTWSSPVVVAAAADEPHLSTIAVGQGGDVYIAGIDTPHGIWIARSTDHGKTFGALAHCRAAARESVVELRGTGDLQVVRQRGDDVHRPDPTVARDEERCRRRLRRCRREQDARRLPDRARPRARAALPRAGQPAGPREDPTAISRGGGRSEHQRAVGVLVRHDVRPERPPHLVHLLGVARRTDVDPARACGGRSDESRRPLHRPAEKHRPLDRPSSPIAASRTRSGSTSARSTSPRTSTRLR